MKGTRWEDGIPRSWHTKKLTHQETGTPRSWHTEKLAHQEAGKARKSTLFESNVSYRNDNAECERGNI